MAYELELWKRDGAKGECREHVVRVPSLESAKQTFEAARREGIARITLARSGTSVIWDLWRAEDRDTELDAQERTLEDIRLLPKTKRRG